MNNGHHDRSDTAEATPEQKVSTRDSLCPDWAVVTSLVVVPYCDAVESGFLGRAARTTPTAPTAPTTPTTPTTPTRQ